jgi:hypothetical protein
VADWRGPASASVRKPGECETVTLPQQNYVNIRNTLVNDVFLL